MRRVWVLPPLLARAASCGSTFSRLLAPPMVAADVFWTSEKLAVTVAAPLLMSGPDGAAPPAMIELVSWMVFALLPPSMFPPLPDAVLEAMVDERTSSEWEPPNDPFR